ncbi:phage head closure protein [Devosia aurantiaca]|uniref:Phage head closure protein n=1 Tax=Devosia aurantiaca TaxID=2714858 RepID=A0A6M1T3B1_9HYPH|nr:phage head closure protein [Devosia aurantiaca]NGP19301.1 phage head closure protein [Devosia aurantiaca]
MDSGDFDRRITLQRYGTTYNEFNEPESGWTDLGKRWASKEDVSDGEKVRAAQVGASVSARFRVRYDALTKTLTAADRLICEDVEYQISGTKEGDGRRREIEITAARSNDNLVPVEPAP